MGEIDGRDPGLGPGHSCRADPEAEAPFDRREDMLDETARSCPHPAPDRPG